MTEFAQSTPPPAPKRGRKTPDAEPFVQALLATPDTWLEYPKKVSALPTALKAASLDNPDLEFVLRRDETNRTISRYGVWGRLNVTKTEVPA